MLKLNSINTKNFIVFQIVAFQFYSIIYFIRYVITLLLTFIFILTVTTNLKIQELKLYIKQMKMNSFTEHQFDFIRKNFVVMFLKWLSDINRIYGVIIFGFICTSLPLNAILVMMLLFVKLSLQMQGFFIFVIILQIFLLFGISLFSAKKSSEYHKIIKIFIEYFVKSSSIKKLKFRIKLSIYIAHFHTTNPYTLNMGKVGKINFALFGRQLFFYIKFLFFAYKFIKASMK